VLRIRGAATTVGRTVADEPVDVGGEHLVPGTRVMLSLWSANHDETAFEDPETLKLDRKPNLHLTFGGGAHYCLGAPLARMEAQIAFRALLREAPDLELAVPREEVRLKKGMALRALGTLPVLLPRAERPRRVRPEAGAEVRPSL